MNTALPFTFTLHMISHNQHITDMTISGTFQQSFIGNRNVEAINYTITKIILDNDDISELPTEQDMAQINNACFNYVQTLFQQPAEQNHNMKFAQPDNLFKSVISN